MAILKIQRAFQSTSTRGFDVPPLDAEIAYVFNWPALSFQAVVDQAASRDGFVKSLVADISNIDPELVWNLRGGGIVELHAGYEDAISADERSPPTVRPIFAGILDLAYNVGEGGSNILHIEASSAASRSEDGVFPVHVRAETTTIGEAIRLLAQAVGGTAILPRSATGDDPDIPGNKDRVRLKPPYTATQPVRREIELLVSELTTATGLEHTLVISDEAPFTYVIVNEHDPGEEIEIDIGEEGDTITHASPMIVRGEPEGFQGLGDVISVGELEEQMATLGFDIDGAFDPRYAVGLRITVNRNRVPQGRMLVAELRSQVGDHWSSHLTGPFTEDIE